MKKLTIKDVAKHANVSIATVSRVMNNHHWASEDAKNKVNKAIKDLGYEPNALARGLVSSKSNTIGVLIPDVANFFSAEIFRGMEDAVHERDSNVFICNTDTSKKRMLRYLKFLQEKQVEGVIFTSEAVSGEYFEAFRRLQVPFTLVATDAREYRLPAVKVNDCQAVRDAIHYLYRYGHRKIGMISGPLKDLIAGRPRYDGYRTALEELALPVKDKQVAFGDFRFHSGRQALKELLERNPDITAIFASSDEMAVGAIVEATKMGIHIPEELSIIGYDNVRISEMSCPSLTTVGQPLYDMGYRGVNKLFDLIQESRKLGKVIYDGETEYVPHRIVERESVSTNKKTKGKQFKL
jgi:LacI family transcriptional regulator